MEAFNWRFSCLQCFIFCCVFHFKNKINFHMLIWLLINTQFRICSYFKWDAFFNDIALKEGTAQHARLSQRRAEFIYAVVFPRRAHLEIFLIENCPILQLSEIAPIFLQNAKKWVDHFAHSFRSIGPSEAEISRNKNF